MKNQWKHLCALALCFSFLLGIKDGRVALWRDDDPEPVKVLPYPVSMLPKDAVAALKKGIPIESEEDLQKLINQYL